MKKLMFAAIAVASFLAMADASESASVKAKAKDSTSMTEAEKAAARQRALRKSGGIVEKKGEGKILFLNCQKKIKPEDIQECVDTLNKQIRVNAGIEDGEWKIGARRPAGVNAVLYIVDDPALPMSLVAPEAQWGVLNVAHVDPGKRFEKMFNRASIMTFGAGLSQFRGSPMQTVAKPEDLDQLLDKGLSFDAICSITRNLQNLGVTQTIRTSYRKACMDGWASAPTNDLQKAIWDEVHALPSDPIKIKYDPKRDK